jgi:hypothetical protein
MDFVIALSLSLLLKHVLPTTPTTGLKIYGKDIEGFTLCGFEGYWWCFRETKF